MNVLVAGGGPAGLYFSYLAKRRWPNWRIRIVEQNPPDATFGFGVVFSDRALEFLRADDPATYDLITPELQAWVDLVVVHRGERVVIDGIGFNAHHYLHAADMSTFVVECDAATWERAGLASMDEANTKTYLERVYAPVLQGAPLVSNKSIWRNFPNVRNQRWSVGNVVLIGDAQRTAHFSIGSGTRLAMEDAIALNKALVEHKDVGDALQAF